MATANKRLQVGFDRHFEQRLVKAGALTPGQKKVLIAQLLRELEEEGRVPLPSGPVRVDIHHPIARAALEGRPVVMGGKTIQARKGGSMTACRASRPGARWRCWRRSFWCHSSCSGC